MAGGVHPTGVPKGGVSGQDFAWRHQPPRGE